MTHTTPKLQHNDCHNDTPSLTIPPLFQITDLYHPLGHVRHNLLRPVLTRGTIGDDSDCWELLMAITSPMLSVAIVEEGQCSCCSAAGLWCITAVKTLYTWHAAGPVLKVVVRCVNCVLHHKACDLPRRTKYPTCVCEWQIPPRDREYLDRHAHLLNFAHHQLGLPHDQRVPNVNMDQMFNRLRASQDWFLQQAEVGIEMNLKLLEPAMKALGFDDLVRDDGKWIVPFRQDWLPCLCYPMKCSPEQHRAVKHEELEIREFAQYGHNLPTMTEEDWQLVKGFINAPSMVPTTTLAPLPDNSLQGSPGLKSTSSSSSKTTVANHDLKNDPVAEDTPLTKGHTSPTPKTRKFKSLGKKVKAD